MLIDLKRCVGCDACTVACKIENGTPPGIWYAPVHKTEIGKHPKSKRIYLPVLCNHCEDAPCIKACPTTALYKRADGIVLVDKDKCCGSRACMAACPYGAIHFYDEAAGNYGQDGSLTPFEAMMYPQYKVGTVQKCTFCAHRIDNDLIPACCQTCPTNCRIFGDLEDKNGQLVQIMERNPGKVKTLRPEARTGPSVYYLVDEEQEA